MDLKELLEKATPRPWESAISAVYGPRQGKGNDRYRVRISMDQGHPGYRYDATLLAHAVNKFEPLLEAFREIIKCEAPFKRDQLEFANSVISRHVEIAKETIRQAEEVS